MAISDNLNVKTPVGIPEGGTNAQTTKEAQYNLLNDMNTSTADFNDDSYIIAGYGTPSTNNGAIFRKKFSVLWKWIQSKISSALGLTKDNYDGNSKSAGQQFVCPTTVGTWSRVCRTTNYSSFLLSIILDQANQAVNYVYYIGTNYQNADIIQLCGGSQNNTRSAIKLRIVNAGVDTRTFDVEMLNTFGNNGATTINAECRIIELDGKAAGTITPVTTFTQSTGGTVVKEITSVYNKIVADLEGTATTATTATIATKATSDGNGNVISGTYQRQDYFAKVEFEAAEYNSNIMVDYPDGFDSSNSYVIGMCVIDGGSVTLNALDSSNFEIMAIDPGIIITTKNAAMSYVGCVLQLMRIDY